jgi:pseudouridylate synthase
LATSLVILRCEWSEPRRTHRITERNYETVMTMLRDLLDISPEIADTVSAGGPVVTLESTIIAHGLPRPRNLETAFKLEAAVREAGAVPATIAVLDGRVRVGLDEAALERLATEDGIEKLSRRDLPVTLAAGGSGATTVAATMICAHLAGISVFATGGIGGVHRGAEDTFDISADLEELARTPIAVVCAGAKAILDLPKTLEVLETKGVPVIGYRTHALPAFWCQDSGLTAPHRADSPTDVSAILNRMRSLGYPGGAVIANPIPEAAAIPRAEIETVIGTALTDAENAGIKGKAVTPYLLDRINSLTGGRSLEANVALAVNNARLAGEIAGALSAC